MAEHPGGGTRPRRYDLNRHTSAEMWAGLQADYDLRLARYQKQNEIERDVEPLGALHQALS
jgi:plasmid maintenance system antidote protein VapI